jgi:penicillin-binding protein 1C
MTSSEPARRRARRFRLTASVSRFTPQAPRSWARCLLALGLLLAALACFDRAFPPPIPDRGTHGSTLVVARDGTPLRAFADARGVWRYWVEPEQVSPRYLEALLGYEDRWFHRHPGVNPLALVRAAAQALHHGEIVSGGSTLTMQVARLIEPTPRNALGKAWQIMRALQLEARLDKRQILTLYLNLAPFGGNLEGVEAASWAYLGKSAARLSHAEAALLAVLPQAPSRLRPDRAPDAARAARDKVLARLADLGVWSAAELGQAQLEPVSARRLSPPLMAPLLAERLQRDATGVIVSTVDARLQALVERRVAGHLAPLPARTSAAVLVVDNASGEALAYVGSGRFADAERLGHVDMVTATRSPGSTLKPFLYGLALDDGLIHSESLLVDAPQAFDGYRPANFGERFNGPVSASDALRLSLNVPAVELLDRVTPRRFVARLDHAGLRLALPNAAEPNLSVILGGTGTTLEQLVGAYTALARGGVAARVRLRADQLAIERRVLSEGAAWIVRAILEAHGRPGEPREGIDESRRPRLAWKTGTSFGFRDSWAIGVTASRTIGVWIGRPDGTPMPGHYGAVTALPLLFALVDALPRSAADTQPTALPPTVAVASICWPLGRPETLTAPEHCHQRRDAWVLDGVVPPTWPDRNDAGFASMLVTVRVDQEGRRIAADCEVDDARTTTIARWPALAQPWLAPAVRRRTAAPPFAPGCAAAAPVAGGVRIDGAIDGAVLRRAPGSRRAPTLDLRALGASGDVSWLVDGRLVGVSRDGVALRWVAGEGGTHDIVALDRGGHYDRVTIRVLE